MMNGAFLFGDIDQVDDGMHSSGPGVYVLGFVDQQHLYQVANAQIRHRGRPKPSAPVHTGTFTEIKFLKKVKIPRP
jgi:hypothetical protein